jgi:uncharacterized membrane protein YbhN (UPF0104 family)
MNAERSRRAWLLRIGGTLLFLALIAFLVWSGQLKPIEIIHVLAGADLPLVLLAVVIYFPFVLIKSERWRLLAARLGVPMTAGEAWRLYAVGLGAGAFTPGQAGDLVKAWALQSRGQRLGAAVASSILDRLFDLAGLAVLAALGIAVFGREFTGGWGAAVALLGLGAVGAVVVFARRDLLLRLVMRRAPADAPPATLDTRSMLLAGGWTVLSFVVSTLRVWLLGVAIGLTLDPATVGGLVGLTTVAALIPISVSGVGTRDAMMVVLLSRLQQPAAAAVAFSILILGLNVANAVFGYAVWWVEARTGHPIPQEAP